MKGRVVFTREAARNNIHLQGPSPVHQNKTAPCSLDVLVGQYSQLQVKPDWTILREEDLVYAESNDVQYTYMDAIRGDESPFSYLQAAMLYHQLAGYNGNSSPFLLQDRILDDHSIGRLDLFGYWHFGPIERSLNPIFFYDSLLHPVVIYFTHHEDGMENIIKHIHRFDHVGYNLKYHQRIWAVSDHVNPFSRGNQTH